MSSPLKVGESPKLTQLMKEKSANVHPEDEKEIDEQNRIEQEEKLKKKYKESLKKRHDLGRALIKF